MRAAEIDANDTMAHLPTKSADAAQTTIAPAAPREDRHTAIFRMLGARSRELAALLGKPDLVDRFRRAAAAHYLAMASASAKDKARMEGVNLGSYVAACMDAAMDGLTPDGREGWIIVRGEIAAWTVSYRGLIKLARRACAFDSFTAEIVYRQEIERGGFDVDLAERTIKHRPWYLLGVTEEPDEMDIVLAYAAAVVVDEHGTRTREFRILTGGELDQRARMSGDPRDDKPSPVWTRHYRAMSKKSAVRAFMDRLPVPDAVWDSVRRDDARAIDTTEAPRSLAAVSPAAELAASVRGQIGPAQEDAPIAPTGSVRAAAVAAAADDGMPGSED